jgi:hypothetical protein
LKERNGFVFMSKIQAGPEDCTRPVRKVFSYFEYLENRACGLDAFGSQPEETLPRIREQSLSCGASQPAAQIIGSERPLTELVYYVTVAFTNLLTLNGDFSFGRNQNSQEAKSGL